MDGEPARLSRLGRVAAATFLALAAAPVASAEERASFLSTSAGPVLLVVPGGAGQRPPPVVLALPDAPGADRRGRLYLDLLNAGGVATVEFLPAGDDGSAAPADALSAVLSALAAEGRVDALRFGVVAWGAAGRATLEEPALADAPAALLYPGCARLPPAPDGRPLLLLHGGVDRADAPAACARWAAAAGPSVRRHEYIHATHGWDFSDGPWSNGLALLPSPGEAGRRVWARADPDTAADAARRVADFLFTALDSANAAR